MAQDPSEYNSILQLCLDRLQREHLPIDEILTCFPDCSDVLRPQLEAAYWLIRHKEAFTPPEESKEQVRQRLRRLLRPDFCIANNHK
jgi:hypothetical protein